MKAITDIKLRVKVILRFLEEGKKQTEIESIDYYPFYSFDELQKYIENYKKINCFGKENETYEFIFETQLDYYENNNPSIARTVKLKLLSFEGMQKLFEYIEEILYVNTSKEIQHSFNYNEVGFFISNL